MTGVTMICFKKYTSRISRVMRRYRPGSGKIKSQKGARGMEISAPFGFRHEATNIPGLSDDELSMLREKALASRVGVKDANSSSPVRPSASLPTRPLGGPMSSNPVLGEEAIDKEIEEQRHGVPPTLQSNLI